MTLNQGTHFVPARPKNVEGQPETMLLLETPCCIRFCFCIDKDVPAPPEFAISDWLYDILSGYTSKFELPLVLEKFRGSVNCNNHESLNLRVYHWIKDSN